MKTPEEKAKAAKRLLDSRTAGELKKPLRDDFLATEIWGVKNWLEYIYKDNDGEKIKIYKTDKGFVHPVGEYSYSICRPSKTYGGNPYLASIPKLVYDFILENCIESEDILERKWFGNRTYLCTMGSIPDNLKA